MSWIRLRTSRSCPISPTPSSRGVPELCQRFEEEVPESIRQLPNYTKVFLEFRSYKALSIVAKGPAYLSDKEFHRLTFCMMLAWEAPDAASRSVNGEPPSSKDEEDGDRDRCSLFISSSTRMAVEIQSLPQNLFDAINGHFRKRRLQFITYDKYLRSLDKYDLAPFLSFWFCILVRVISVSASNREFESCFLGLEDDCCRVEFVCRQQKKCIGHSQDLPSSCEIVLDNDGTVPTMLVLQHIGILAWPWSLLLC
ncbi:hypothetical protein MLD38_002486 [Melastoma candidum]|uniref:Uncharacterized protein n=1 Tax=Melastoma candidum TaxID=119954 RepID=A0ACB9RYY2_9MYRT|nr:hypothetical protein MLD38_002486 [Melastoma candidum]